LGICIDANCCPVRKFPKDAAVFSGFAEHLLVVSVVLYHLSVLENSFLDFRTATASESPDFMALYKFVFNFNFYLTV